MKFFPLRYCVLLGIVLCLAANTFPAQFAAPQTNRLKININTSWKFYRGDVTNAQAATYSDVSWTTVHLPHTIQNLSALTNTTVYRGIGWYRKHFTLNSTYSSRRITLFFEGAMTVAQLWINGIALPTHYGGYNPFCYDISQYCKFDGTDNVIAVRLDNTYQSQVPPEKPDNSAIDYCIFGGLYRNAFLIVTDNLYIPEAICDWNNSFTVQGGQFITFPSVNTSAATVKVDTWIKNVTGSVAACKLVTTLVDAQNAVVQSVETSGSATTSGTTKFSQTLNVQNPHLWYPYDLPYRYTLYTVVYNGTTPVDLYSTKIGIRQFTWTKTQGFYCNNQPIKLLGLNRHQQWPYVGGAVPDIQQVRDAVVLKTVGCNFVRCSHYLQSDAFMNACDSLGMMLWVEIPGWASGYTPSVTAQPWTSRCQDANRSNMRHARNHPSVAVWGAGVNEAWQNIAFDDTLQATAKKEDTTRPTSQTRNYSTTTNVYDLYGGNWFTDVPTSNPDPKTLGLLITEHTGHTYPTWRSDPETTLVNHAYKHEYMTQRTRQYAFLHGNLGWCAFDYNSGNSAAIANHGVMDLMHIPKYAYYFYQSQCAADNYDASKHPMVFIENRNMATSPLNRKVFTNCDSVRLYKNGTLIGTQIPNKAATPSCAHPPVNFANVAYAAGELRAEAYLGGVVAAVHSVKTPGTAARIMLTADPDTIEANGSDFSRVIAAIVDTNGTVIPAATTSITFSVAGGTSIGQNPVAAIAGYHMVLAQATLTPGTITVTATGSSLASNQLKIVVKPISSIVSLAQPFKTTVSSNQTPRIATVIGNMFRCAGKTAAGTRSVAVFDLMGKCVYKAEATSGIVDLQKHGLSANKLYIIQEKK